MNDRHLLEHGARLAALERRVDAIMRHLGLPEPEPITTASPEVLALARQGNLIGAIKLHREQTGLGLAEAKAAVEAAL